MSEPVSEKPKQDESDWGWIVPVLITVFWFGAVAWYLNLPYEKGGEKLYWIEKIAAQDPSNFGDFLSGAFAPVAFLWLAYSVWIQKQELSLTRKVMEEQADAQNESAKQSENLSNLELFDKYTSLLAQKFRRFKGLPGRVDAFRVLGEDPLSVIYEISISIEESLDFTTIANTISNERERHIHELDSLHEIIDIITKIGVNYSDLNILINHVGLKKIARYVSNLGIELKRRRVP
ncbi:MAG: hypothetical protein IOC49_09920 [Methylobacterium sp.]|nr:hypothetical protein [Methylobacterium sp.]